MKSDLQPLTRILRNLVAMFAATVVVSACGGGGGGSTAPRTAPPPAPPVTVTSVSAAQESGDYATATEVVAGTTAQFVASARKSDHTSEVITSTATWTSSDDKILAFETPNLPGLATAKKPGAVTITVTDVGGIAGTLPYIVIAPVPVGLTISPALVTNSIPVGQRGDFKATYTLSDKSTADATTDVDWSSSAGATVVVGNAAGNKGNALALADGKSNISASKGTLRSQDVEITVFTPAQPPQFVVEPVAPSQLPLGRTQQFRALLKYSNDQVHEVTEFVAWQTNAANIANFPIDWPKGLLLANPTTTGSVAVTAQDPTSGAQSSPITVSVSNPTIVKIAFTPVATADNALPVGAKRQLGVIATYSDNKSRDITQTVNWAPGGLGHLSVINAFGSKGLVTANQETPAGTAKDTIVVTDPVSGQSTSLAIETVGRTVSKVSISPIDKQELPLGQAVQFSATAVYTDGTADPVTEQVTWISAGPENVSISNTQANKGKATAIKLGESVAHAEYVIDGEKKSSENFVHVVVTAPTLESLIIKPTDPVSLAIGRSQRLTVDGVFSDGQTRDISGTINWKSQDSNIAAVATSGRERGTVTGVNTGGPIVVTATEPRSMKFATKQITVTGKTFDGIAIFPAGPVVGAVGVPYVDFVANAVYSDGSGDPITEQVQWASSNGDIAAISNEPGSKGHVYPRTVGDVTITASAEGVSSAPVTFRVDAAVLQSIALTPSVPQGINIGDTIQFAATGSYSDGVNRDITASVFFDSSNKQAALVTNNAPNNGKLVATGAGLADISAAKDGITSTVTQVVVASPTAITTVAQIRGGCCTGQQVTLQGRATVQIDGDDYMFEDSSGSIKMEWEGQPPITLGVEIFVTGQVESSNNEVEVSNWTTVTP